MSLKLNSRMTRKGWTGGAAFAAMAAILAMGGVGAAQAQQSQPPAQTTAPKQQQQQKQQDAWVKVCEPIPGAENTNEQKNVCLTHHERIDGNTGIVVVSAAIRTIDGRKERHLLVTVPLGVILPSGALMRVDEGKPVKLPFVFCHVGGCLAEIEATPEIIDNMKKGGKLGVLAVQAASKKPVVYEIPLTGFTKAVDGNPVDSEQYRESRKKLLLSIRERQVELAKKAAEAAKNREGGGQPAQNPQ